MSFRPINLIDAQHNRIPLGLADLGMNTSRGGTDNIVYVGYCRPGTVVTDSGWLIAKQTYDSTGTVVRVRFATTGTQMYGDFDKVWDDSAAVTITAITKASPANVTTSAAHGYSNNDIIEIVSSDATEANGDGYGSIMYTITVVDTTHFTLGIDSSAWVAVGTSGSSYKRDYANYTFA